MDDLALRKDVLTELEYDPSFDAAHIGVAVEDGVVTLSGHVDSYQQKLSVEAAARRIRGVTAIAGHIEIRFPEQKKHADDEIAGRAVNIISWNTTLPPGAIKVKVEDAIVTLSGEVRWHFQRTAAEAAVLKLGGVKGIRNLLTILPAATPPDVRERIELALKRNAEVGSAAIRVKVLGRTVVLEGSVRAAKERQIAAQAAWAAPGVGIVENRLVVA